MTTTARRAHLPVEHAGERLRRQYDEGIMGFDDLGALGWDAFQESRRRFLNGDAATATAVPARRDLLSGRE
jgi:hypothetical protein